MIKNINNKYLKFLTSDNMNCSQIAIKLSGENSAAELKKKTT